MKQFMKLQPKNWQAIYALYLSHIDDPDVAQKFTALAEEELKARGFADEQAASIASALLKTFTQPDLKSSFIEGDDEEDEAKLSLQDIKLLKEKLLHEPSPEVRRLL